MSSASGWLACHVQHLGQFTADVTRRHEGRDAKDVEIWIQNSHRDYFIQSAPSHHDKAEPALECWPLRTPALMAESVTCLRCLWFDTESPLHASSSASKSKHVAFSVPPEECLLGSFSDPANPDGWLERDLLVHQGRYAAACFPSVSMQWWRLVAAGSVAIALAWFIIRCIRQGRSRRSANEGGAAAGGVNASRAKSTGHGCTTSRISDSASQIVHEIHEDLLDQIEAPEPERRQIMRRYLMRWHPDKNPPEDRERATVVLQFLNSRRDWFLGRNVTPESATLLP